MMYGKRFIVSFIEKKGAEAIEVNCRKTHIFKTGDFMYPNKCLIILNTKSQTYVI